MWRLPNSLSRCLQPKQKINLNTAPLKKLLRSAAPFNWWCHGRSLSKHRRLSPACVQVLSNAVANCFNFKSPIVKAFILWHVQDFWHYAKFETRWRKTHRSLFCMLLLSTLQGPVRWLLQFCRPCHQNILQFFCLASLHLFRSVYCETAHSCC